MGRKRLLSPEFFEHAALFDAEQSTGLPLRLGFAALWCQADRRGCFRWRPRELKLRCLPYDDVDFGAVLAALATFGFVQPYVVDGVSYGYIPSFGKWQTFNVRERHDPNIPEYVPDTVPAPCQHGTNMPGTGTGTGTGTGSTDSAPSGAAPARNPDPPPAAPAVSDPPVGRRSRDTWMTPLAEAWEAEQGEGSFPFARAAKALKPLVSAHGAPEVAKRLGYWLRTHRRKGELKFLDLSCARFAATWSEWNPDAPAFPGEDDHAA